MNLEQAREQALTQLETDRHRSTLYEGILVAALATRYDVAPDIWTQVNYDLRTYSFFDALAMWLDEENGLAAAVPEMMGAVADLFIKEVTDG